MNPQRRIVAELDTLLAELGALKRLQTEIAILDRAFKGEL
jgi:hypothetical protein